MPKKQAQIEPNPSGLCQCGCGGRTLLARKSSTRGGQVRGKPMRFLPGHRRVDDLTGQQFGALTVLEEAGRDKHGDVLWLTQCACGRPPKLVRRNGLRNGDYTGCGRGGCPYRNQTHGHTVMGTASLTYSSWNAMKDRCLNPKTNGYSNYGGRTPNPVTICPEWIDSFETFLADLGPRPSAKHSIGRLNNALGYFRENCAWELSAAQHRNKRSNVHITWAGQTRTLAEWADHLGVSRARLGQRRLSGWSVEAMLTTPVLTQFASKRAAA